MLALEFGKRLRTVREAEEMSRPVFGSLLELPPTTIKNYELGYRHTAAEVILGLYHAFGANIAFWALTGRWLLGETKPVWQIIESGYTYFDGNIVTVKEFKTLR